MKTFTHLNTFQSQQLETIEKNGSRWYITPSGKHVPSVTTVLGSVPKPHLAKWKERVGCETATRIKNTAATRGTKIHKLLEGYIDNVPISQVLAGQLPITRQTILDMLPVVDRIDNVHCQEVCLYSEEVAGRTDVVAEFDGLLSIIDFKTSLKPKKKEWITDYFEQSSEYSHLYERHTGIPIKQIVIIIAVDGLEEPQVFTQNEAEIRQHLESFNAKLRNYTGEFNAT